MIRRIATLTLVLSISLVVLAADKAPVAQNGQGSLVIVFKDGHRQSIPMSDVSRIEFSPAQTSRAAQPTTSGARLPGFNHYVGKWEVGTGNGGTKFIIELRSDGTAEKSLGASHGTWTVVNGEAQISWDDGWHDAIRKVGSKHEKFAYEPGRSFSDQPSNVTEARATDPKPL